MTGKGSIGGKKQLFVKMYWKDAKLDMEFKGDLDEPQAK